MIAIVRQEYNDSVEFRLILAYALAFVKQYCAAYGWYSVCDGVGVLYNPHAPYHK